MASIFYKSMKTPSMTLKIMVTTIININWKKLKRQNNSQLLLKVVQKLAIAKNRQFKNNNNSNQRSSLIILIVMLTNSSKSKISVLLIRLINNDLYLDKLGLPRRH